MTKKNVHRVSEWMWRGIYASIYLALTWAMCMSYAVCNVIANKKMSHLTRLINLQKLNSFKLEHQSSLYMYITSDT